MTPIESISQEMLFKALDGIEKTPKMYGDALSIEGLYWMLLMLLAQPKDQDRIRKAFAKASKEVAGASTNVTLTFYLPEPEKLVVKHQEICKSLSMINR